MRSSDPPNLPERSPIVFVFFDPWTLGTGRLSGMVGGILDRGFTLLDFEFKTLSEADAEEIYRTNHPIREENSWHIARLVYPMGRSVGFLFGRRDAHSCACASMQRLKGKANPSLNKTGQLRYDFMAPNRCLSLMHSSDNLTQVKREALVFFSADRIDKACVCARENGCGLAGATQNMAENDDELGLERIDEPGVGTLFARIRLRLIKALQHRQNPPRSRQGLLSAYREIWEPLSKESGRRPVLAEAADYLRVVQQEEPLLNAIIAPVESSALDEGCIAQFYRPHHHEPSLLLQCLRVLNRPQLYPKWDGVRQLPPGMLYDRWEQLLFTTHLFNFDDLLSSAG